MRKVTLKHVAEKAGVGTATVERVLNGRGGVRPQTVEKVIAAVRKLDYPKRVPERHRGVIVIEVILVQPQSPFFDLMSKAYARIAATLDPSIAVHRTITDDSDPEAIARRIASSSLRRSALIVAVPEHALIISALRKARADGVALVQIVNRIPGLDADYVGIDNEAAGRMAGLLLNGMQPRSGAVVALCHSQVYANHRDRLRGFSEYLSRQPGRLDFREAAFTHDDDRKAAEVLAAVLRTTPDLVGIYNVGGNTGALCDQLRASNRTGICFIGHELTEDSAAALRDGTMAAVIDEAPETQARRSLDLALQAIGLLRQPVQKTPIRFVTITAENL